MTTVAALYVDPAGVYANLPGVEVWDEARDARTYAGPWPVVAHPPCNTWSNLAHCRPDIIRGEDGGSFVAALEAVQTYGGVLEHPALSHAWSAYMLPKPATAGWTRCLWADDEWTCEVDQAHYGYGCRKPTWLYYVGPPPPTLRWGRSGHMISAANFGVGGSRRVGRSATPPAFRDVLLGLARSSSRAANSQAKAGA